MGSFFKLTFVICLLFASNTDVINAQHGKSLEEVKQLKPAEALKIVSVPGGYDPPCELIHVANYFIALGKIETVQAIEQFLESEESDSSKMRLCMIVPILFPLKDQEVLPPREFINLTDFHWTGPFGDVRVIGDIPIDFYGAYASSGIGSDPPNWNSLVAWIKKHGKMRGELNPIDDPAALAKDIESSRTFIAISKQFNKDVAKGIVRRQLASVLYEQALSNANVKIDESWSASNLVKPEGEWKNVLSISKNAQWDNMNGCYIILPK